MEFRNRNFRRNLTVNSPSIVASTCDMNILHAMGKDVFVNRHCGLSEGRPPGGIERSPGESAEAFIERVECRRYKIKNKEPDKGKMIIFEPPKPWAKGHCPRHSHAVTRARAWLADRQCEDTDKPEVQELNDWAREATRAANLKNLRKRMKVLEKEGKNIPQYISEQHDELKVKPSYTHDSGRERRGRERRGRVRRARASGIPETSARRASTVHWEEVLGPNGETIFFELQFEDGRFVGRRRAPTGSPGPQRGSIILDTTQKRLGPGVNPEGIKIWRQRGTRRRPMPTSPQLLEIYKNSFLYKVRQLAAGEISLQELHDATRATGPDEPHPETFRMGPAGPHWRR